MTGRGRLQAWLKRRGVIEFWEPDARRARPRDERKWLFFFLLAERGNWRVERGESSRHAAPPLPALVPLSKAGGTAVLTVSVLTGWESPGLSPTSGLAEAGETTPVCPLGGGGGLEDGTQPRNASSSSSSSSPPSSCCCCWTFNRTKLPMKNKPKALIKRLGNLRGEKSITMSRGGNLSCTNNRKTISAQQSNLSWRKSCKYATRC